jgi:hypothetical protein
MTEPVNIEQRRGSAAVSLRRLAHPGRDASAGVEDDPAVCELIGRLEEIVASIERRTAELDERDGAAPRPAENVAQQLPCGPLPRCRTMTRARRRSPCALTRRCVPSVSRASLNRPLTITRAPFMRLNERSHAHG